MSKYHTFWPRFWAGLIDGVVFIPVMLIDSFIDSPARAGTGLFLAWTTVSTFSYFFYSVLLHWKYGQTLGKRVCGVRVMDLSESRNPRLSQSMMREAGWVAMALVGLIHTFQIVMSGQYESPVAFAQGLGLFAIWGNLFWAVLELATMLTNDKRRALHDFLAKTVVVRVAEQRQPASEPG